MQQNGVDFENLRLEDYGTDYGIGLKAMTDIKVICSLLFQIKAVPTSIWANVNVWILQKADVLLEVPYKMMMTAEKAKQSYLGMLVTRSFPCSE